MGVAEAWGACQGTHEHAGDIAAFLGALGEHAEAHTGAIVARFEDE